MSFKKGDKVRLVNDGTCPYDEQIVGEMERYIKIKDKTQTVTKVKKTTEEGTTGQWVETNLMDGWWDKSWFRKVKGSIKS